MLIPRGPPRGVFVVVVVFGLDDGDENVDEDDGDDDDVLAALPGCWTSSPTPGGL